MSLVTDMMDNLERIGKTEQSTGGDVTTLESYDENDQVGPQNDFSRDFLATTSDVTRSGPNKGLTTADALVVARGLEIGDGSTADALQPSPDDLPTLGTQSNPDYVRDVPAANISTAQFIATSNPMRIVNDNQDRRSVIVMNTDPNNTAYIGSNSAVGVYNGFPVIPGAAITLSVSCELWAVSASPTPLAVIEFLD